MGMPAPAMVEDDFWSLIGLMEGQCDDDALARLTDVLQTLPRRDVVAFQERLAQVLYALDREELAVQPVRFADDPPGEPIPLGDDMFLYLRTGIVALGRHTYEAVLADPSLLAAGEWQECEELLYAVSEVLGEQVETSVSYETGANATQWSARPEPDDDEPYDASIRSVVVVLGDLLEQDQLDRALPDRRVDDADALPHVDLELMYDLTVRFSTLLTQAGGLPATIDAEQVQVLVEFADGWCLEPEVSATLMDPVFDIDRVRQVSVAVPTDAVRGWTAQVCHEALSALAARSLLAVLPPDHPARAELEAIHNRGAHHLGAATAGPG